MFPILVCYEQIKQCNTRVTVFKNVDLLRLNMPYIVLSTILLKISLLRVSKYIKCSFKSVLFYFSTNTKSLKENNILSLCVLLFNVLFINSLKFFIINLCDI